MPALPFFALAVASILPRPLLLGFVVLQAALCCPLVVERWATAGVWTLTGLPWRAALRLDAESDYVERQCEVCAAAQLLESHASPHGRVFSFLSVARAYTSRDTLEYWHSNQAEQLNGALWVAWSSPAIEKLRSDWTPVKLRALRLIATDNAATEWRIFEMSVPPVNGTGTSSAFPNRWEAALAFDGNRTTGWRTRDPQRKGMFIQVDLHAPRELSGIEILMERNRAYPSLAVEGQGIDGSWRRLSADFRTEPAKLENLRAEALRFFKASGFRYLLTTTDGGGMGMIGKDLAEHPKDWGVEEIAGQGLFHLLGIH